LINSDICSVASADSPANYRISSASTLKPRPASPALAASMAAFKTNKLVWAAMSLIRLTISPSSF